MIQALETLTIPIEGMTCGHCVATVRSALESVPGVKSAEVDLTRKIAEVTIEPGEFDRSQLKDAIGAVGYMVPPTSFGVRELAPVFESGSKLPHSKGSGVVRLDSTG
jgi:copper chaperone CopZ